MESSMKKRQHKKNKRGAAEPEVGIFFLVGSKLLVERTSLAEAGTYADCMIHEGDHIHFWEKLLRAGAVPESEYDEHPRGRVVFNLKTEQFLIYADKCILSKKALVAKIKHELHLPKETKTSTDSHYRCPACLQTEQEE
jgi:hypothetical protein